MANPDFSLIRKKNTCPCKETTWNATGDERCVGANVEAKEESNCGNVRWTVARTQTWTATGDERCNNHLIEQEEVNDCGSTRWTPTTTQCGYCPSLRLYCSGEPGFGFHTMDPKDPAATVELTPCPGDTSVDSIWIYPSAGPAHTVRVVDESGVLIGYAANTSDCAPDCGCVQPVTNVHVSPVNNFSPVNNTTLPAPNLVATAIAADGAITNTLSDGSTVVSNPLPTC